jgi:SAM-dependent methyltransferase
MAEYVVEFGRIGKPPQPDGRLDAPAFHRNHAPIWSVLAPHLADASGDVLEIGSGTGQHVVAFAANAPALTWWPSDPNPKHCRSIEAWRRHAKLANVRPPLCIDISDPDWRRIGPADLPERFRAMLCLNVLHITPWSVTETLLDCAANALAPDGQLFVYGPFMRDGRHTAPSNAAFDASLRRENPCWGVRDISLIGEAAQRRGLRMTAVEGMPANNMMAMVARVP